MRSPITVMTGDFNDISFELLLPNKKIKLLPESHYKKYDWNDFRYFCHQYARYGIPTVELIDLIKSIINGRTAIEIGAGHGDFAYHLGIPATDRKLQNDPLVKLHYLAARQPLIEYPEDVEEIEALEAVEKYKPQVVFASWVTCYGDPTKKPYGCNLFGVKENKLLESVETYILFGNLNNHGDRPLCGLPHKRYNGHISRAKYPENNRLFVWNKD